VILRRLVPPFDPPVSLGRLWHSSRSRHGGQSIFKPNSDAGNLVSATVLLVDDEAELRQVVARALEEEGFRVLQAENGLEAWRVFEEYGRNIQLVITDIVMPGLGGRELADRIGGTPHAPPVLFITGYGRDGLWLPGPVMPKPFQLDALNAEVRRLLAI
jgi:two-component system cell cycle sensor histidine kinase/response regulator CckA